LLYHNLVANSKIKLGESTANRAFYPRIIAVHGLGGHPINSWTLTENPEEVLSGAAASCGEEISVPLEPLKTLWLRDLLSPHSSNTLNGNLPESCLHLLGNGIQGARIRTFGWDSTRAAAGEKLLGRDCIRPVALELLRWLNIHDGGHGPSSAEEEAKVPLVFVAMDLGGAIVKQVRTKLYTAFRLERGIYLS